MPTIDVQVHAYERNHPSRPWVGHIAGPDHVTGDEMVAAMDAVGVNGAILVSPFSLYRYDASYALEVYAAHPERFRLVKPVDTTNLGLPMSFRTGRRRTAQSVFGFFSIRRPRLTRRTQASTGPSPPPSALCR